MSKYKPKMNIDRIKEEMKLRSLSQAEVGRQLYMTRQAVFYMFHSPPSLKTIARLAKVLRVHYKDLLL